MTRRRGSHARPGRWARLVGRLRKDKASAPAESSRGRVTIHNSYVRGGRFVARADKEGGQQ